MFVPLALVVLAAILVNILNFHITMEPSGIGPGLLATLLWFVVASGYRAYLAPLFVARATSRVARGAGQSDSSGLIATP